MKQNWKRNAAIFLSSQAISLFGSALVQYAIVWHITLETQSGTFMMLSIIFAAVPQLLLTPFAGVWADRYNRKLLIILSDGFIAASTLVMAILFSLGHDSMWLLLVVTALRGFGSAVQSPSVSAMLPDLVPTEQLTRVNGINGSIQSAITFVAPMLSAALIKLSSLSVFFYIDVVTATVAIAILILFLKIPARERTEPTTDAAGAVGYLGDMKKGLAYIGKTKFLMRFMVFNGFFSFLITPIAMLSPLQVTRNYGAEVWYLTAIELAWSAGMLHGGLLIAAWGGFRNRFHTMMLATFVMSIGVAALGFSMPFWAYITIMGLMGIFLPITNTVSNVILQSRVDPDFMGRIFSVFVMLNSAIMPLGMVVFGPLADAVNLNYIMLGTGIAQVVTVLLALRSKTMFAAGEPV